MAVPSRQGYRENSPVPRLRMRVNIRGRICAERSRPREGLNEKKPSNLLRGSIDNGGSGPARDVMKVAHSRGRACAST
jgi:hypothetical protein